VEFNFANEQFSDKKFAHFDPLHERKRKQKPKECSASLSEAASASEEKVVLKEPELINLDIMMYN